MYQYILNLIRSCWFAIGHVLLMVQIARSLLLCVWWLSHVGHLWSRQIWTVTSDSHIRHPGERKTHKTLKAYVAIHLTLQRRIENKQKRVNHYVLMCRLLHNIVCVSKRVVLNFLWALSISNYVHLSRYWIYFFFKYMVVYSLTLRSGNQHKLDTGAS